MSFITKVFLTADTQGESALGGVWENINTFIRQPVASILARIIGAILIFFIGIRISKSFLKRIDSGKIGAKINKTLRTFLRHLVAILLYTVVVICTFLVLGVDLSVFSAAIASIGVTVGLALQGGLSNIAGGIMIVSFKPFQVGDYVESSGVDGTVTDIGIFYTTLTTPDNKKVVVPNGIISNAVVTNYSAHDTRRIDFDFTVSYTADLEMVKRVLGACAKSDSRIFTDPKPQIMIVSHAESAIVVRLRVWVKNSDYWDVYFAMMEQAKLNFDEFGIEIPYPQLDVHIQK